MFASGTTQTAQTLRGRRRQSIVIASSRLLRSRSEKERKKSRNWRAARRMFGYRSPDHSGEDDDEGQKNPDGSDDDDENSGSPTIVEIPISKRRQVALIFTENKTSPSSSSSEAVATEAPKAELETSSSQTENLHSLAMAASAKAFRFRKLGAVPNEKKVEYFSGRVKLPSSRSKDEQDDIFAEPFAVSSIKPATDVTEAKVAKRPQKVKFVDEYLGVPTKAVEFLRDYDEDEVEKEEEDDEVKDLTIAAINRAIEENKMMTAPKIHRSQSLQQVSPSRQSGGDSDDQDENSRTKRRQTAGSMPTAVPSNLLAGLRRLKPIVMKSVPSEREQQFHEHKCPPGQCQYLRINVAGLLFEICASYLEKHPKTLLGDRNLLLNHWECQRKEFFFDRHRPSFEGIFAYYKYGDLPRKPDGVPDDVFLDELYFFRIEDDIIDQWKASRGIPVFEQQKYVLKKEDNFFRRLWYMFEFPAHSKMSYTLNIISVIAAIIAVCCLIFESMPNVSTSHCLAGNRPNFLDKFFIIESACTAWFTTELLVRTIGAPSWRSLMNYQTAIDVAANTPYFFILFSVLATMDCSGAKSSASTGFLRIFRLFSVFKLSDRSGAFALIANTFKASTRVLTLFFLALAVCVVLFGSFIYIIEAEADSPQSEFQSIADGFWWAVITMTTVGYGDLIPRTVAGKIVGSCCAIVGVITLSMPIPILTENFNKFYKQMKKRKSMVSS